MTKQLFIILTSFFCLISSSALALENAQQALEKAGVTTQLGSNIDTSIILINEKGEQSPIKSFMLPSKPLLIAPVYYECPRLCGLFLTGVKKMVDGLGLKIGQDYSLLTVSFNTEEGPELAAKQVERFKTTTGWHFTVGRPESINPLMEQLGFTFARDGKEFSHAPVLMVLTPEGKISQYFTNIEFSTRDIRLALVEASEGKIGTPIDHFLLFCFRFDPLKGKYTWAAWNALRVGVILSVVIFWMLVVRYSRKKTVKGTV